MLEALKEKEMEKLSGSMNKLTTLRQGLGVSEHTKLLIIHADDAGLSHAENRGTIDALEKGSVNSYSMMVPCPWFYEIAAFARLNPHIDHGIHLTLTCEWHTYKFGPVLSKYKVPSLVDKDGYFYKTRQEVLAHADLDELKSELCAQIDRALSFGLQPTHLDSHMYTLGASSEFLQVYRDLGQRYKLPVMLNSGLIHEMSHLKTIASKASNELWIDHLYLGDFQNFENGTLADYYANVIQSLKPNLNMIIIHPAYDDPEMRSITKNHPNFGAAWRQIDLDFFTSSHCRELLENAGVQMISWKEIRDHLYT